MATVGIVVGAVLALFGACVVLWSRLAGESSAWTYHGVMFGAMGLIFIVGNAVSPGGLAYVVTGALGVIVAWSGWKHITILRRDLGNSPP